MNIQKLKFSHFRNYETASFSFESGAVHILFGENAQGKTNILESIYFLSHLRSFRTNKLPSLIQHGENTFVVECLLENKGRTEDLKAVVNESKKRLYRYGNPVSTYSSFVGIVNAILFCPNDLNLFSQSPKARRQFIDMELVKLSKSYTATLSHYQKMLKERNIALKSLKPDSILIDTYTNQMIDDQIVLIEQRHHFLKKLQEHVRRIFPLFSNAEESLDIVYKTFVDPDKPLKEQLERSYKSSYKKDCFSKNTSLGIHKDDVEFHLNGKVLTQTASQGQQRSALLAIKLALTHMIKEATDQYPILLLDDVFGELDAYRRQQFISCLPKDMQIFITTTEIVNPAWFDRPVKFYTVQNGVLKEGIYYD